MEKRFAAGDVLFWEGELCAGIFLIIQGSVKIFRTSPGGRELMLSIYHDVLRAPAVALALEIPCRTRKGSLI